MKPKEGKADKINYGIGRDLKELVGNRMKVVRIALYEPQPDEIKVNEMKDKKCQY